MKLHVNKWNKRNNECTMFIITEDDIINGNVEVRGVGYEILVIPIKYKKVFNKDVDLAKTIALSRVGGEIIYV